MMPSEQNQCACYAANYQLNPPGRLRWGNNIAMRQHSFGIWIASRLIFSICSVLFSILREQRVQDMRLTFGHVMQEDVHWRVELGND